MPEIGTGSLIALYVIAGVLELGALGLLAWDVIAGRRAARAFEAGAPLDGRGTSWNQLETVGPAVVEALRGTQWRRWTGLALLAGGLLIGTIANLLSAVDGS